MSDKNKKSVGGRIALDITVLLLILASVAGIVLRIVLDYPSEQTETDGKAYYLTLRIDKIYNTALDCLKAGDKIYLTSDGDYIGEIKSVEPYPVPAVESDGFPYEIGAVVRVQLTYGRITDGSFRLENGMWLTRNGNLAICTDSVEFNAVITDVGEG